MSSVLDLTDQQLDSYYLLCRLGSGTFGDVYEATDLRRHERVAVKVLEPIKTPQAIQQFFSEVRALVRLRHAHIVPIIDFGIDAQYNYPFIVMLYAPKGSLRQKHKRGEQLPLTTVVRYVKQLADALQYAHDDRFIHRDVKPDNVLLDVNSSLLLSDFGIATSTSSLMVDLNQPMPQNVAGSAYYMAPEQCQGKPEKASDQYALGIMAYEWLTGTPPFTQGNMYSIYYQHINIPVPPLRAQRPDLSPQIEAVILKALSKRYDERYPAIQAFAQELEKVCSKPPLGTRLLVYRGHCDGYNSVAWSPDGSLFATSGVSGLLQVWNAVTGVLVLTCEDCSTANMIAVAWSPDGTRLASAASNRTIQVWEASSGKLLHRYTTVDSDTTLRSIAITVAWSPDGTRLASGNLGGVVQVWEASSGKLLHRYNGHPSYVHLIPVNAVAWSPDGTRLASASADKTVIWDASSGKLLHSYTGHTSYVNAVAWSPDGTRLASASWDGTVQVWGASSGKLLYCYTGHTSYVNAVAWSPDGTRLVSASSDETVQVWEVNGDKLLHRYTSQYIGIPIAIENLEDFNDIDNTDFIENGKDAYNNALHSFPWHEQYSILINSSANRAERIKAANVLLEHLKGTLLLHISDQIERCENEPSKAAWTYLVNVQNLPLLRKKQLLTQELIKIVKFVIEHIEARLSCEDEDFLQALFNLKDQLSDSSTITDEILSTYTLLCCIKSIGIWAIFNRIPNTCIIQPTRKGFEFCVNLNGGKHGKHNEIIYMLDGIQTHNILINMKAQIIPYSFNNEMFSAYIDNFDGRSGVVRLSSITNDKADDDTLVRIWIADLHYTPMVEIQTYQYGLARVQRGLDKKNRYESYKDLNEECTRYFGSPLFVPDGLDEINYWTYRHIMDGASEAELEDWCQDGWLYPGKIGSLEIYKAWVDKDEAFKTKRAEEAKRYYGNNGRISSVRNKAEFDEGFSLFDEGFFDGDEPSFNPLADENGNIRAVAVTWLPDGARLALVSMSRQIRRTTAQIWQASSGKSLHSYTYNIYTGWVNALAWSPDGTRLASASADKTVQVWEANSGKLLHYYTGHTDDVRAIAWSPDGTRLASASDDRIVQVWEASSGKLLYHYTGHTDHVRAIAWSPDGTRLASASDDRTVQVWEANSGKLLHRYTGYALAVAWSPDDTRLASASDDRTVQVWEANSGKLLHRYTGYALAVAWSPDGTRLAFGSYRDMDIWEVSSEKLLYTCTGHTKPVSAVAWSPDGTWLASASGDGTVQVWQAV